MKKYKNTIVLSTIICLIPILMGIFLWNKLPNSIATHFNNYNQPDGWSSKGLTVFGLPTLLTVIHLISIFMVLQDPKKKNVGNKMLSVIFWLIPILSLFIMSLTYAVALGYSSNIIGLGVNLLIGVIFVVIGNYFPKTKQNYTVGIKIPWTLNSEENWNKTHRFASKLWIVGGILFIFNAVFLIDTKFSYLPTVFCLILVLIPIVYSFILYKREVKTKEEL